MNTEDHLEEIREEIELEPIRESHPWVKKAVIGSVGAFMLFLILTYFLGYMAFDNIPGLIESEKIKDYAIDLDDGTRIVFNSATLEELNAVFKENDGIVLVHKTGMKPMPRKYLYKNIQKIDTDHLNISLKAIRHQKRRTRQPKGIPIEQLRLSNFNM